MKELVIAVLLPVAAVYYWKSFKKFFKSRRERKKIEKKLADFSREVEKWEKRVEEFEKKFLARKRMSCELNTRIMLRKKTGDLDEVKSELSEFLRAAEKLEKVVDKKILENLEEIENTTKAWKKEIRDLKEEIVFTNISPQHVEKSEKKLERIESKVERLKKEIRDLEKKNFPEIV